MGNTNTSTPLYRRKIDDQGNFLPFPGYTIVAHTIHPLPQIFTDLIKYLSNSDLKNYYAFLPEKSYHVTINPLENVRSEHLATIREEQRKLKERNTFMICRAKRLTRSGVIQIEIDFHDRTDEYQLLINQVRSHELRELGILHDYKLPWHLTLAYRYKFTDEETIEQRLDTLIDEISSSIRFPFAIPLESVRICSYQDLTHFQPI